MSTSRNYTAGQVLTATQANDWSQGILAKAQITSDSSFTSGSTTLDIVTAPAVTPAAANRLIRVSAQWRSIVLDSAGGPDIYAVRLQEGSTVLQEQNQEVTGTGKNGGVIFIYLDSPSAASHTYKMTLTRINGSLTAKINAASTYPCQIVVEDVGHA